MATPPHLGRKHACFRCKTVFYDLNRSPVVCPKCGATPGMQDLSAPAPIESTSFDRAHAASVLAFWRSCEYFSVGRVEPLSEEPRNLVLAWGPTLLPPWSPEHPCHAMMPALAPAQARLYVVSCGLFDSGRVKAAVLDALRGEPTDDEAGGYPSAVLSFLVTEEGHALRESLVIATAPWALGRTFHPGPSSVEWLAGFDAAFGRAADHWWEAVAPIEVAAAPHTGDPETPGDLELLDALSALDAFSDARRLAPLDWAQAQRGLDAVCAQMRFPERLEIEPVARVRPIAISRKNPDRREIEIDLLNSFFIGPLANTEALLEARGEGAALRQYLLAPERIDRAARLDLRQEGETRRRLQRAHPLGRWPSPSGQRLDPSQQLAVNALFDTLQTTEGLFAINGPPGTGKTTLLRDVIAAVVTLRARELASLRSPEEAFQAGPRRWKQRFEEFGIVVASSNNAALENITREIPGLDAIDPSLHATIDYFKPYAERLQRDYLLNLTQTQRTPVAPRAWGLVAATLGRSYNRRQFVDGLWWKARAAHAPMPSPGSPLSLSADEGLRRQMELWSRAPAYSAAEWREATARFKEAMARESASRQAEQENPDSWDDARAALFVEALSLHRVFIEAAAGELFPMLGLAMEILKGGASSATQEAIRDAWTALFILVPAISTTFASFGAMFARLGGARIGWLLIDEAGQASPQSAAGAIASAKRVVIMGDPQQLEPVVATPPILLDALRAHHHLPDGWTPGVESAQTLGDRVARHGTDIPLSHGRGALWVGAPLLIHRRCDEPMFGLANEIAYGGLMRRGTLERPPLALPASGWIDIDGDASSGHWIPKQGEALTTLLRGLLLAGVDKDELFLISPFRTVAAELRRRAQAVGFRYAGTIHTVQGKEAEIVVLVLGGDRTKPRARSFATRRPNLLNVAVTRAKRRLYVVGDRAFWGSEHYFRELAEALPPLALKEFEVPRRLVLQRD